MKKNKLKNIVEKTDIYDFIKGLDSDEREILKVAALLDIASMLKGVCDEYKIPISSKTEDLINE